MEEHGFVKTKRLLEYFSWQESFPESGEEWGEMPASM